MAQLCPPKISCVFFSHVNLSDGLTILTGDRAIKLKEKESEVTEQLVKSYFSCLLTMQECPSFAKTIFFIPQSQGLGKKKTLSSISHTLAVCVWMCKFVQASVLSCLSTAFHYQDSCGGATLNTHIVTQKSWCAQTRVHQTHLHTCLSLIDLTRCRDLG